MPTYDYICHHCGHRFEVIHGVHAEGPAHCPVCGKGPVRKAFSAPSIVFKGSGWAKKDRSATSKPASSGSKGKDGADGSSTSSGGGDAGSGDSGSAGSSGSDAPKPSPEKSSTSGDRPAAD